MIHDSNTDAEPVPGLRLGVKGWRHGHWLHSFYPEDLPEDWQLAYYANEFSTVLVPQAYFAEAHDVTQWLADVPTGFRFYFEQPSDAAQLQAFLADCTTAGEQLAGVIRFTDLEMSSPVPVYAFRNLWRPGHEQASDVAIVSLRDADLKTQRQWLQRFAAQCAGNCQALLVSDEQPDMAQLRELRTLIELLGL